MGLAVTPVKTKALSILQLFANNISDSKLSPTWINYLRISSIERSLFEKWSFNIASNANFSGFPNFYETHPLEVSKNLTSHPISGMNLVSPLILTPFPVHHNLSPFVAIKSIPSYYKYIFKILKFFKLNISSSFKP